MFKFPWTRNAEDIGAVEVDLKKRLGKLEIGLKVLSRDVKDNRDLSKNSYETARDIGQKAIDDMSEHKSGHITKTQINFIENVHDELLALNKVLDDLKDRIGKDELIHVGNFERMNDNFERGMETLISQSSNTGRYLADMAIKKISEVTELLGGIRIEDQPSTWEIVINAKAYDVGKKEVSYHDILAMGIGEEYPEEIEFSIDFRNSAEVEKRDGKLQDGDSITIQNGTIFMVTRSDLA